MLPTTDPLGENFVPAGLTSKTRHAHRTFAGLRGSLCPRLASTFNHRHIRIAFLLYARMEFASSKNRLKALVLIKYASFKIFIIFLEEIWFFLLTKSSSWYIIISVVRETSNELNNWVWRSLVACLNGVQEAGGSNPLTQTSWKPCKHWVCKAFCYSSVNFRFRIAVLLGQLFTQQWSTRRCLPTKKRRSTWRPSPNERKRTAC